MAMTGTPPHRHRRLSIAALASLAFLVFVSASAVSPNLTPELGGGGAEEREGGRTSSGGKLPVAAARRRLGGPGSSPPTCKSKCGQCTPCEVVHVPIHPGSTAPLEYYPEAWRCRCGDKLFLPRD
ncbi:hypothetical protein NMG60_11025359 [Bertholletia excelsa]